MNIGTCNECKWFEERSGFCRFNPPIPTTTKLPNGKIVMKAVFPKISNPEIDWCSNWERYDDYEPING